jgi:murein DD-endopeptidase MepM/ murein hydrolase activator NlpD
VTLKLAVLAAALAAALTSAAARADVFTVAASTPLVLPTASTPNTPGSLLLPITWTQRTSTANSLTYAELHGLWQRAGVAYGIPWQVLAAINKIESNFGRNMGPSSAGAVGWMQFMPDTWLRWGMDANGDRFSDPWDPHDAVYAAARYLAAAGAREDLRRGIFAYNHANWYVDDVLELAKTFGDGGGEGAFALDGLAEELRAAELKIVEKSEALVAARARKRRAAVSERRLLADVGRHELFSERLVAEKRATLAGVTHARWTARVAQLELELEQAEEDLAAARARSQAAAFDDGAGMLLAAPTFSGDYVFPVGGGASQVSVAATHHDYPAADIAAPAGSPLYALADSVVRNAWSRPDARCGIGLTIETGDALVWTYCHLAYLERTIEPGVRLEAGAPVGLVGSTGHSTGPHLHLQLQPPTVYPQSQAWFQSFAGSAFRWQGEPPPLAAPVAVRSTDVFAAPDEPEAADEDVVLFTR